MIWLGADDALVRVQFPNVAKLANLQAFIIYFATEAAKEANVFKYHQGDDNLVSDPHESIEEFETRVREVTDHRLIVICAAYIEPEWSTVAF